MDTKHTPGPWEPRQVHPQQYRIDAPNGDPAIGHPIWDGLADVYGCDDVPSMGREVARANALLIAAAPDLLAALQVVVRDWTEQFERNGHLAPAWCKQAKAAVAKALGVAANANSTS